MSNHSQLVSEQEVSKVRPRGDCKRLMRDVRVKKMKNILIIGPPASGKLTLAKELARRHGHFLFDNHRSIDAITVLTVNQAQVPQELLHSVRKTVLAVATQGKVPTIFTMVYDHPHDSEIMDEYVTALTNEQSPLIVQLHCDVQDSMRRCTDDSRVSTSKITKPDTILEVCSAHDLNSDYKPASKDVLHINTSREHVAAAVEKIEEKL
ncbi:MAG: AAA family ATPase [bacterium]